MWSVRLQSYKDEMKEVCDYSHKRERDGCSLIDDQQLGLAQLHGVTRVDVLLGTVKEVTCVFFIIW